MWLSKFLDLKDDLNSLKADIKNALFKERKSKKLTPLEFTILEQIFNYKEISGYDLIASLNRLFAGTWKAKSGTIYPLLSKLSSNGFLKVKQVKSPIGPLKKVYYLTEAGEELLKYKVNKNYKDQVQFLENFLIELSSVYINSHPEDEQSKHIQGVQQIFREMFDRLTEKIPLGVEFKMKCPNCNAEMERSNATYCAFCGSSLHKEEDSDEFTSAENLNDKA